MAAITVVSDLKPFKSMWKIRVKIIHLWKKYSAAGGLTIEMVLIDSNLQQLEKLGPGEIYSYQNPMMEFTLVNTEIGFLLTTRMRSCVDFSDALNGFEPVNYKDIRDGTLNTDYSVDLCGAMVVVGELQQLEELGPGEIYSYQNPMMEFTLETMMKMAIDTEDWEEEMNTAQIVKPYMDRIVLDYLVTEGKLEAAHIFMEESLIRLVDERITQRVAIVEAIKAGDLNFAKEELSAFKPEILRNFHLLKQQFIQLIREERHNDAFDFAQLHLKPFHEDMAFLKQVEEVMSLLVFENISTCPVKDFLGESQWLKTASEVNAAILSSFGKGPKLQRLLKKLTLNQKQLDERAYEYPRMSDMSTGELIYPEE
ncbi:hypothetical protein Bca4012_003060 [Brassica carinata]